MNARFIILFVLYNTIRRNRWRKREKEKERIYDVVQRTHVSTTCI